MIVVGEASGDAHAAALVNALRECRPNTSFDFFGATGRLMRDADVESVLDSDDLSIMGIVEVGRVLPRFWRAFRHLRNIAVKRQPDAVILVDWPEFNLKLARSLHRRGLRVIYYISPQLWAWRSYRANAMSRDVDLLLSILPFEKQWYAERGIHHVEYVGNPLAGQVVSKFGREEFCRRHDLDPGKPIISLLAGSRHKELQRIFPPMLDAANVIWNSRPDMQFVVVVAPTRSVEEVQEIMSQKFESTEKRLRVATHETREALAASDAVAVASGTVTLEATLIGTPMVIVYKESPINWHVLGSLINTEHFGLVNLVAGQRIVTELMQNELTGERLAQELLKILEPQANHAMRARLKEVAQQLGEGGASERAAKRILKAVGEWKGEGRIGRR